MKDLNLYKQMMHNFLAESTNIFIQDGLTSIQSVEQQNFKSVTPGVPYGMRVRMFRSMDYPKRTTGSWGEFKLPQNIVERIPADGVDPRTGENRNPGIEITAKETLTMYSRPSAFGPPLGLISNDQDAVLSGSQYDFAPRNGVYSAYTPPYYDGECWYDIIFWPRGLREVNQSADGFAGPHYFIYDPEESGTPYVPTLPEIFASPAQGLFSSSGSAAHTPLAGSFVRKWRFDQEELLRDSDSTYHLVHGGTGSAPTCGPAAGPYVNEWSMQLDASLNIFGVSDTQTVTLDTPLGIGTTEFVASKDTSKWTIQTKFETPILNFNHISVINSSLTITDNPHVNPTIPRGMWHQFGRLPSSNEGVFIQVTDIPKDWLNAHPSASLVPDMMGKFSNSNKSAYVHSEDDVKTFYNKYGVYASKDSREFADAAEVRSLVDICGFDTAPKRIGETKNVHTMFEAIVAVPFTIINGKRKFFDIIDPTSAALDPGKQILRLEKMMKKYIFPPAFDFVNNSAAATAIAMYVFQFSQEFTKNDLMHMWQNLPPKWNIRMSTATANVSHELIMSELLASQWGDSGYESLVGTPGWEETLKTTPSDPALSEMRWMVFKVKQRAKKDYYAMVASSLGAPQPEMIEEYTPNWPYDFCSIVEMVKLDVSVKFDNKPKLTTGPASDTLMRTPPARVAATPAASEPRSSAYDTSAADILDIEMTAERAAEIEAALAED